MSQRARTSTPEHCSSKSWVGMHSYKILFKFNLAAFLFSKKIKIKNCIPALAFILYEIKKKILAGHPL